MARSGSRDEASLPPLRAWEVYDVRALSATDITTTLNEYHQVWLAERSAWEDERAAWAAALEAARAACEKEIVERESERAIWKKECDSHDAERVAWDQERVCHKAAEQGPWARRMDHRNAHTSHERAHNETLEATRTEQGAGLIWVGPSDVITGAAPFQPASTSACQPEPADQGPRELAVAAASHAAAVAALKAEHETMLQVIIAEKGFELYQSCGGRRWCSKHWQLLSPRPEIQDHLVASGARRKAILNIPIRTNTRARGRNRSTVP